MNNDVNTTNNQVTTPKKKGYSLIVVVVGLLLIVGGVAFFAFNNGGKSDNDQKEEEPPKTLRKILPEELNDDTAAEIVQFFLETEEPKEKWNVTSATLSATDEEMTGYVIDFEATKEGQEGTWYRQTIIKYENETWSMELPTWANGEKDISMYDSFYGEGE